MPVWIEVDLCDGCGRCVRSCPYDAVEVKEGQARILERCTSCGACLEVCKKGALRADMEPRVVPDFSDRKGVWVFAEQREGELSRVCLELLGKGRELADTLGQELSAVLLGERVEGLAEILFAHGADGVYIAEHDSLRDYRTLPYTRVIEGLIREFRPNIFLLGATSIGRDLAPRVSRRVGSGLTADCTDLAICPDEKILLQTRPAFGGNIMATIVNRFSRPQMATVRPGVMEARDAEPGRSGKLVRFPVSLPAPDLRTEILERVREKKKHVDISQAKVIVAGGRGVGNAEGFALLRELASVMDGEVAGTRVAVEEGWIAPESQVGQTGRSVRPEIYVACGISGAIQHRAGMMSSRYIIAVNKDPRAPIFQVADWGIVGDLYDVVPEMIRQLKAGVKIE